MLMGTTANAIATHMAVDQPVQQIFVSVERGPGTTAAPAIVKVNHGRLETVDLDNVTHSVMLVQKTQILL
jgi:hypothetical protein